MIMARRGEGQAQIMKQSVEGLALDPDQVQVTMAREWVMTIVEGIEPPLQNQSRNFFLPLF